MPSLFELTDDLRKIEIDLDRSVDPETGELDEALAEKLFAAQVPVEAKLLDWARWAKNERAEMDKCKVEADKLAARAKSHKNRWECIKRVILENTPTGKTLKDGSAHIYWGGGEGVVIDDEAAVPDVFCKIERTPKLKDIGKYLTLPRGTVSWAHLEKRRHVVIK